MVYSLLLLVMCKMAVQGHFYQIMDITGYKGPELHLVNCLVSQQFVT